MDQMWGQICAAVGWQVGAPHTLLEAMLTVSKGLYVSEASGRRARDLLNPCIFFAHW